MYSYKYVVFPMNRNMSGFNQCVYAMIEYAFSKQYTTFSIPLRNLLPTNFHFYTCLGINYIMYLHTYIHTGDDIYML